MVILDFGDNKTDILNEMPSSEIPENIEELKAQLNSLHLDETKLNENMIKLTLVSNDKDLNKNDKKTFFDKVKTFLGEVIKNDKR